MCFCNPDNKADNCGSAKCRELAAADVLGLDTAQAEHPQPLPPDDRLEIPLFLRRNHPPQEPDMKPEANEEAHAAPEETQQAGEETPPAEDQEQVSDQEGALAEIPVVTEEDLLAAIRKLTNQIKEKTEAKRLLKVQLDRMVKRL